MFVIASRDQVLIKALFAQFFPQKLTFHFHLDMGMIHVGLGINCLNQQSNMNVYFNLPFIPMFLVKSSLYSLPSNLNTIWWAVQLVYILKVQTNKDIEEKSMWYFLPCDTVIHWELMDSVWPASSWLLPTFMCTNFIKYNVWRFATYSY